MYSKYVVQKYFFSIPSFRLTNVLARYLHVQVVALFGKPCLLQLVLLLLIVAGDHWPLRYEAALLQIIQIWLSLHF